MANVLCNNRSQKSTAGCVAPRVRVTLKGQWQRKFLLAISVLLDDLTMKILSFPSRTF